MIEVHREPAEYLSADEVCARWSNKVAPGTLAQWRSRKRGPAWTKLGGHVLYRVADVAAYEAAQRRQTVS